MSDNQQHRFHHDFETYSEADLRNVGGDVYARHPSTEPLMLAYATDDLDIDIWVPAEGQEMPTRVRQIIADKKHTKFAWNKPFEYSIWKHCLGITIPHHTWRDPMVMAMSCSLPGSLGKAGKILGIEEDKQKDARGKALIKKFCQPRKPTKNDSRTRYTHLTHREEWEEFKEYCIGDVEAERAIYHKLVPYDLPRHEWNYWVLDQIINQAGIPINTEMVENAIRVYEEAQKTYMDEMKRETGLANPNSIPQLLPWLQERGYPFDDMKKGHVERAITRCDEEMTEHFDDPHTVAELTQLQNVMELRIKASAASVKKYYKLRAATAIDGCLRNCFAFCGAQRTWRWGGRLYQPQNLPRPDYFYSMRKTESIADYVNRLLFYSDEIIHSHAEDIDLLYGDPISMLKSMIRPAVQAPEGMSFIDSDLNAIENRVLGWLADDKKILRVFELKRDPYVDFASYMYHRPYEELYAEYKAGDKGPRTVGKPAVLGCGYQLGAGEERENKKTGEIEATGLLGYAWNMGVKLTADEAATSVTVFRETFTSVVKMWRLIEKAALDCVRDGGVTRFGKITFDLKGPFLRMNLPSGRSIHYFRPRIQQKRTPWGAMRDQLTYEGLNAQGQWHRQDTYGGKLTENATQAVARDLLAHGMRLAAKGGIDIRMHVHDQIVGLCRDDEAEDKLAFLQQCMGKNPDWAPDLPLASAGHICKVFLKD